MSVAHFTSPTPFLPHPLRTAGEKRCQLEGKNGTTDVDNAWPDEKPLGDGRARGTIYRPSVLIRSDPLLNLAALLKLPLLLLPKTISSKLQMMMAGLSMTRSTEELTAMLKPEFTKWVGLIG